MESSFQDLHVVVTGAAGALGGAVVRLLLERGAVCHLPILEEAAPAPLAAMDASRALVTPVIDLSDERAVRSFYDGLPALWASVHCAGGFAMTPVAQTSLGELTKMWSMNAASAFLCCREAVRSIRRRGADGAALRGGRIVNVTARPALEPRTGAGMVAYCASKSAVAAITQALAEELAAEHIWVNAVAPAILDTEANRRAMGDADRSKWAAPDEVARTIAFLASPENRTTRGGLVPVYAGG